MTKMSRLTRSLTVALGLGVTLTLASCGQTTSPAAEPTPSPSESHGHATTGAQPSTSPATPSSSKPAGRRLDITVQGKKITPAPATVNLAVGESLTIAVTSDHDDTLHAHGFEIAQDIKANKQTEVTIKGAQTGIFEFELHHPELRLFQVAVR